MADKYSHFDMRAFRGHFRIASDHFEGMCKQFEALESLYKKAQSDNEKLTAERDALKAEVEAGKVRSGQPYWWCPKCKIEVDGKQVTYWERHEMCGGEVEIKTEPYTEAKGESK